MASVEKDFDNFEDEVNVLQPIEVEVKEEDVFQGIDNDVFQDVLNVIQRLVLLSNGKVEKQELKKEEEKIKEPQNTNLWGNFIKDDFVNNYEKNLKSKKEELGPVVKENFI